MEVLGGGINLERDCASGCECACLASVANPKCASGARKGFATDEINRGTLERKQR